MHARTPPCRRNRRCRSIFARWTGTGGITATSAGHLRYLVTGNDVARLRARQPTDDNPIPLVVSPSLAEAAGPGGILPLDVGGTHRRPRRRDRAADPDRLEDVVIADGATLSTALDAAAPGRHRERGSGWTPRRVRDRGRRGVAPPAVQRRSTSRRMTPCSPICVRSHSRAARSSRSRPQRWPRSALALVGLLLVVVSDLRDERGELFDLEAQGAEPNTLRRHLRLRTAFVAAFGLVGGIVTGVVLAALVVSLVTLTASAGSGGAAACCSESTGRWCCSDSAAYFLVAALLVSGDDAARLSRRCRRPLRRGGHVSAAIEVRDVFRVHQTAEGDAAALQGLSLTVREDETVTVLGPSGSGQVDVPAHPRRARPSVGGDRARLRHRARQAARTRCRALPHAHDRLRGPALRARARAGAERA